MTNLSPTTGNEREERLRKLKLLNEAGVNAYPATCNRTHALKEVIDDFDEILKEEKSGVFFQPFLFC